MSKGKQLERKAHDLVCWWTIKQRIKAEGFRTSDSALDMMQSRILRMIRAGVLAVKPTGRKTVTAEDIAKGLMILQLQDGIDRDRSNGREPAGAGRVRRSK